MAYRPDHDPGLGQGGPFGVAVAMLHGQPVHEWYARLGRAIRQPHARPTMIGRPGMFQAQFGPI